MRHPLLTIVTVTLLLSSCTAPKTEPQGQAGASSSITAATDVTGHIVSGLPIVFEDTTKMMEAPMEKPGAPSPCQPTYFQLSDIPNWAKDLQSFNLSVKDKEVHVQVDTITEARGVGSIAPFSIRSFDFSTPDCHSKALAVFRDDTFHALYTHVDGEWSQFAIDPARKEMLLHSTVLEGNQWKEQLRRVNLDTKQTTTLPLAFCFLHGALEDDGSIYTNAMEPVENGSTISCQTDLDGTLLYAMHPVGVKGTSLFVKSLGTERHLLLAIDINSNVTKLWSDEHALLIFNLQNPTQTAALKLPAVISGFEYGNTIDFDTTGFDFAAPKVRMRYRQKEDQPWQEMLVR